MSEYRDDRRGLRERIAELELALRRAERRADQHVADALRVGELEHENRVLLQKLKELDEPRIPLLDRTPAVLAGTFLATGVVIAAAILLG